MLGMSRASLRMRSLNEDVVNRRNFILNTYNDVRKQPISNVYTVDSLS